MAKDFTGSPCAMAGRTKIKGKIHGAELSPPKSEILEIKNVHNSRGLASLFALYVPVLDWDRPQTTGA